MSSSLFTPSDGSYKKRDWAYSPNQTGGPRVDLKPGRQKYLTFFSDTRIWVFILTILSIGFLHLDYQFLSLHSKSLPEIPHILVIIISVILVPPLVVLSPILIRYPRFSALITQFDTPRPTLLPPLNTTFVQIRIVLLVICFIGHIASVGISLFSALELLLGSATDHYSQIIISLKLLAWSILIFMSGFTSWLSISASNDELRSLSNYKKVMRVNLGLSPDGDDNKYHSLFVPQNSPTSVPIPTPVAASTSTSSPPLDITSTSLNSEQTNVLVLLPTTPSTIGQGIIARQESTLSTLSPLLSSQIPTSPHYFDYHHQTLPFSPVGFLPHHDHYRQVIEPYNIKTQNIKVRRDPRIISLIISLLYLIMSIYMFTSVIVNVDQNNDGDIFTEYAPPSWYVLLSMALAPIIYHICVLIGFQHFSLIFTTIPKNLISNNDANNDQNTKYDGNLAASAILDNQSITSFHDSLFSSTISPHDYAKQISKRLKHLEDNKGRNKPLLLDSGSITQVTTTTTSLPLTDLMIGADEYKLTPLTKKWSLVPPFQSKHICMSLIILQLGGFLFRLVLTLGSTFLTTIMFNLWIVHNPDIDFTRYSRIVPLWGSFSILGFILCYFSFLAIIGDIKAYNRHDTYHNDWLMFESIPTADNEFLAEQLDYSRF